MQPGAGPPAGPNGYHQPASGYQQSGYQRPGYPAPPQPDYYLPQPAGPQFGRGRLIGSIAVVVVATILSAVAVVAIVKHGANNHKGGGTTATSGSPSYGSSHNGGSKQQVPTDAGAGLTAGSGPVTVDLYVDYQCPPCSDFESATSSAVDEYLSKNRITLIIHPVAFIDGRSKNKYSTRAAAAVACAYEGGKLVEFHKYLLENQPDEDTAGPTDDELVKAGKNLGLGSDFQTCVTDKDQIAWVAKASSAASDDDVSSVPTVYVNDTKITVNAQSFQTAVDNA